MKMKPAAEEAEETEAEEEEMMVICECHYLLCATETMCALESVETMARPTLASLFGVEVHVEVEVDVDGEAEVRMLVR